MFYLYLLNYFGISIVEGQELVVNYIMTMASISLLGLLCFINIVIYLLVINYLNKYVDSKFVEKYPKLSWILNKYKKMQLRFIISEFIFLFISLLMLFVSSMLVINQIISG